MCIRAFGNLLLVVLCRTIITPAIMDVYQETMYHPSSTYFSTESILIGEPAAAVQVLEVVYSLIIGYVRTIITIIEKGVGLKNR